MALGWIPARKHVRNREFKDGINSAQWELRLKGSQRKSWIQGEIWAVPWTSI